jgi:rare lipoprotein A
MIKDAPKILTMLGILFAMIFWDCYCDYRGETEPQNLPLLEESEPTYEVIEQGIASHYGYGWDGRTTASGEILDCDSFQAAHLTLPFGTIVQVISQDDPDKSIIVKIVDRGPHVDGRVIDLTPAAFLELAPLSQGVIRVELATLTSPDEKSEVTNIPTE